MRLPSLRTWAIASVSFAILAAGTGVNALGSTNPTQSGSTGLQGTVSSAPPTAAPTISTPTAGQHFTSLPVTVSGLCQNNQLVKVFANNVFVGSVICTGGSYTLKVDLFDGSDDLIARIYDALDQQGPDSNRVTVSYTSSQFNGSSVQALSLTSDYARRGANPGSTLTWPIILGGGTEPYALSVSWGDNKPPDLLSESFPGTVTLSHIYDTAGSYQIVIKATDKSGQTAFLQLVGVANGAIQSSVGSTSGSGNNSPVVVIKQKVLWLPAMLVFILLPAVFWLGRKSELTTLRKHLQR